MFNLDTICINYFEICIQMFFLIDKLHIAHLRKTTQHASYWNKKLINLSAVKMRKNKLLQFWCLFNKQPLEILRSFRRFFIQSITVYLTSIILTIISIISCTKDFKIKLVTVTKLETKNQTKIHICPHIRIHWHLWVFMISANLFFGIHHLV